jgi:hypothetical protein
MEGADEVGSKEDACICGTEKTGVPKGVTRQNVALNRSGERSINRCRNTKGKRPRFHRPVVYPKHTMKQDAKGHR